MYTITNSNYILEIYVGHSSVYRTIFRFSIEDEGDPDDFTERFPLSGFPLYEPTTFAAIHSSFLMYFWKSIKEALINWNIEASEYGDWLENKKITQNIDGYGQLDLSINAKDKLTSEELDEIYHRISKKEINSFDDFQESELWKILGKQSDEEILTISSSFNYEEHTNDPCGDRINDDRYENNIIFLRNLDKHKKRPKCPLCYSSMKLRDSDKGVFYGCVDYPECKGKRRLDLSIINKVKLDPATGKPKKPIYIPRFKKSPEIIKVIFVGTYGNPYNCGTKWSQEHLDLLKTQFESGVEIDKIAFELKRDLAGTIGRLQILGCLTEKEGDEAYLEFKRFYKPKVW